MANNPQLDRLKAQLLSTGIAQKNNALFQVIDQMIDAVRKAAEAAANINVPASAGPTSTYLTVANETATLPNSRRVLAGAGITLDDSVANVRTVSVPFQPSVILTGANEAAVLPNSRQLLAGTGVVFNDTVANQRTVSLASGAGFITGTGHPQGAQSYAVGTFYIDTNNGRAYQKLGGGSTAYGWYYVRIQGAGGQNAPQYLEHWPRADSATGPQQTMSPGQGTVANSGTGATTTFQNGNTFGAPYISNFTGTAVGDLTRITLFGSAGSFMIDAGNEYDWVFHFRTGASITGMRIWCKVGQTNDANSDTMGGLGLGFRYSTVAGDTGFTGVTRDGTTQHTWGQVGANIAANTHYFLRMRQVGTNGFLSVNDSTEVTTNLNMPAAGNAVGIFYEVFNTAGGAGTGRTTSWFSAGCTYGGTFT